MLTNFYVTGHLPNFKMISGSNTSPVSLQNTINKREKKKLLLNWTDELSKKI